MKVLLPEFFKEQDLRSLPKGIEVVVYPKQGEVPRAGLEAEFLVASFPFGRTSALIEKLPNLKVIQTLTAGVDTILPFVPRGVTLCNATGVHDVPMAELMVSMLMALLKNLPEVRDNQTKQSWTWLDADDLEGKTVLFLGYGSIAQAIEKRLEPFGAQFIRVARRERPGVYAISSLSALLPLADAVILLLPLTEETTGIFGRELFSLLKLGALFINGGRGKLVDTEALVEVLQSRRIRAALDVADPEPLPKGHPLWNAPGVLITPHIGGSSPGFARRAFALVRQQLEGYVSGKPLLNVVENGY